MIRCFIFAIGILLLGTPVFGEDRKDMERAYKRFDSFGYPDCERLKFVKVATGCWIHENNKARKNRFKYGFLLTKSERDFSIFSLELREDNFKYKIGDDVPVYDQVSFEEINFKSFMKGVYKWKKAGFPSPKYRFEIDEQLGIVAQLFALSWFCKSRNLPELQASFFTLMKEGAKGGKGSWSKQLLESQCQGELWGAVVSFADPNKSREVILKRFEWLNEHFKGSKYHERIERSKKILAAMVQEDQKHSRGKRQNLEKMPLKSRVTELIFQLREQRGSQWDWPEGDQIYNDLRGEKSPAAMLVSLGFDAIPQLIKHVGDRDFTRSVTFGRDFYFSHNILRVGDCAISIISKIACRGWNDLTAANGAIMTAGQAAEIKKLIQEWWSVVQKKGEKQFLIDGVERGDNLSVGQVNRLIKKFPKSAVKAILTGYRRADEGTKIDFMEHLSSLRDVESLEFIRKQVKVGSTLYLRTNAARLLLKKGHVEAMTDLIRELQEARPRESGVGILIHELLESRDSRALQALVKKRCQLALRDRQGIIEKIIDMLWTREDAISNNFGNFTHDGQRLLENLLIDSLSDEMQQRSSGIWYGKSIRNSRVCDMAGHVLTMIWPQKYHFDLEATFSQRDRDRVIMGNTWRKERKKPVLKVPDLLEAPKISAELAKELVTKLRNANDAKSLAAVLSVFEKNGLGTLKLLVTELKEASYKSAARKSIVATAATLANTTQRIDIHPLAARSDSIKKYLASYQGKALTKKAIFNILYHFAINLPKGFEGLLLIAERSENRSGLVLRVQFLKERVFSADSWLTRSTIIVNKDCIHNSYGSVVNSLVTKRLAFPAFSDQVSKTLKSPANQSILICARLEH